MLNHDADRDMAVVLTSASKTTTGERAFMEALHTREVVFALERLAKDAKTTANCILIGLREAKEMDPKLYQSYKDAEARHKAGKPS
jgi:hypothetical protein